MNIKNEITRNKKYLENFSYEIQNTLLKDNVDSEALVKLTKAMLEVALKIEIMEQLL